MLGFRQVDAAEVTFGEYDTLSVEASEIVIAKVVPVEFPFDPDCFVIAHAVSRAAT